MRIKFSPQYVHPNSLPYFFQSHVCPPVMLHCLHSPDDFSGKSRPGANAMKWLHQSFEFSQSSQIGDLSSILRQLPNRSVKAEDSWDNAGFPPALRDHFPTAGPDFRGYGIMGFELPEVASSPPEMGHSLSRTSSCQLPESGENSLKKRKAEVAFTEEKSKRDDEEEEESKPTEKQDEASPNASKVSESPKPDYIHVRARRGQATDSHSLAERARREKISKKMKYLQDLVPGCNKITGKAGMLDEIINYVQSLQRQVEFLSLKLATMNPRTEFKMDTFLGKEIPAYVTAAGFQAADGGGGGGGGCSSSSSEMPNLGFLQFQAIDPSPPQMTATNSSTSDIFTNNSASFSPFTAWETDLQTLYSGDFQ